MKHALAAACALSLAGTVLGVSGGAPPAAARAPECTPYMVIGLRGSGQAMDGPLRMGGTTGGYAEKAIARLPAGEAQAYSLPYPAWPVTLSAYPPSVREGRHILALKIRRLIARCPDTNIGLIGYSQGAHVIDLTVRGLHVEERKAIRAVLLLSDPINVGTSSYSETLSIGGTVVQREGSGVIGSPPEGELPSDIRGRVTDFCIESDPVCDAPHPLDLVAIVFAATFAHRLHSEYDGCCDATPAADLLTMAFASRIRQEPASRPNPPPPPALPPGMCPGLAGTSTTAPAAFPDLSRRTTRLPVTAAAAPGCAPRTLPS